MQLHLTPHRKKLIIAASKIQIDTWIELHQEGHPIFNEMLEEYKEDTEKGDIDLAILAKILHCEELEENVDRVWDLNANILRTFQWIILRHLPEYDWPIAKRSLFQKLQLKIDSMTEPDE